MGTPWLWNETDLTSLVAQTVKHLPTMQETQVQFLVRKISWRRERQPTPVFLPPPAPPKRGAQRNIWEQQRIANWGIQLWQTICKYYKAKERKLLYRGVWKIGRGYYKLKVHGRKLRVHWLRCDSFSLAKLLPGREKLFLLLAIVKDCHFLPEMQGTSLPVGP